MSDLTESHRDALIHEDGIGGESDNCEEKCDFICHLSDRRNSVRLQCYKSSALRLLDLGLIPAQFVDCKLNRDSRLNLRTVARLSHRTFQVRTFRSPRRNRSDATFNWFTVGCVTTGLFFVQALAILLAAFDAATWRIKAFLAALALGKSHASVRHSARLEVTVAPSPFLRQNNHHLSSSIVLRRVAIRE